MEINGIEQSQIYLMERKENLRQSSENFHSNQQDVIETNIITLIRAH